MNITKLSATMRGLINSSEMWWGQFQQHKDAPSVRNAMLAIVRLQGALIAYGAINDGDIFPFEVAERLCDERIKQLEQL